MTKKPRLFRDNRVGFHYNGKFLPQPWVLDVGDGYYAFETWRRAIEFLSNYSVMNG